jgi:hypothetical protein
LILSKTKANIDDLSDVDLNEHQCIIRLGEFYRWYWGVPTFLSLKKNNLSDFEYCCGNMKGEFKGSPEELIDYLFKFVKNGEDYALCTIISGHGEWEFEIDFKDIGFDETSVDPLPKSVIHRLPDNFSADINFDESLLNERLVLSKNTSSEYTLDILDKDKFEDTYKSLLKQFAYSGKPVIIKNVVEPEYYVSFEETDRIGYAPHGVRYFRILKPTKPRLYETYDIRAAYNYTELRSIKLVKEWERGSAADIFPRRSKYNNVSRIGIYKVPENLMYIVTEIIDYYKEKHNKE